MTRGFSCDIKSVFWESRTTGTAAGDDFQRLFMLFCNIPCVETEDISVISKIVRKIPYV